MSNQGIMFVCNSDDEQKAVSLYLNYQGNYFSLLQLECLNLL